MPKYWITKYALSEGIIAIDGEAPHADGYASVKVPGASYHQLFKVGGTAFLTEGEAKADAEKTRIRRIASLKKQIAKLEKLRF